MSNRWTRRLFAIHRWTGLIVGVNLLILSLTAVYLLGERIVFDSGAASTDAAPLIDEARRVPVQPILDKLAARFEGHDVVLHSVGRPIVEGDDSSIGYRWGDTFFTFQMDVYTGVLTRDRGEPPPGTIDNGRPDGLVFAAGRAPERATDYSALGEWMLDLHGNLLLGNAGLFIVGIVGVLFFISTATGLYLYAPFMKALSFGAIRRTKLRYMFSDAHKLIGIASLAFNAMIAVTGIGITLGFFAIQYYLMHELRGFERAFGDVTVSDPYPDFEAIHSAAQTVLPDNYIYHVRYPGGLQGDKSCIVFGRPDPWKEPFVPSYAAVTAEAVPRPMHAVTPLWVKAILVGAPIHYGEYGGRVVRVAYLLFALTSGALSVSGFAMWFSKRRAARRARRRAPAVEAIAPAQPTPSAASEFGN